MTQRNTWRCCPTWDFPLEFRVFFSACRFSNYSTAFWLGAPDGKSIFDDAPVQKMYKNIESEEIALSLIAFYSLLSLFMLPLPSPPQPHTHTFLMESFSRYLWTARHLWVFESKPFFFSTTKMVRPATLLDDPHSHISKLKAYMPPFNVVVKFCFTFLNYSLPQATTPQKKGVLGWMGCRSWSARQGLKLFGPFVAERGNLSFRPPEDSRWATVQRYNTKKVSTSTAASATWDPPTLPNIHRSQNMPGRQSLLHYRTLWAQLHKMQSRSSRWQDDAVVTAHPSPECHDPPRGFM